MTAPFDSVAARTVRDEDEPLVTLQEAAVKLSVPVGTLYSWVSRGEIERTAVAPGGKALFRLSEIADRYDPRKKRRRR